jgi:hypothetical protein
MFTTPICSVLFHSIINVLWERESENDDKYLNPNPNLYYYIDKTHYATTTTPNKFSEYHVPIYKFSIRKK